MNIEGLDYNTQREQLILPEYGREIQSMVNYAVGLTDRNERQHCAETIIAVMRRMVPQSGDNESYEQKLWDHLALMSGFRLDIDYPFDVTQAVQIAKKPEPMPYPMKDIPIRHYGNMMFELFEQLKAMPDGPERDELIRITANQMKRDLSQWGQGSADDEKVADDLARFTDGKVQLDLENFLFDKTGVKTTDRKRRKK